MKLFIGLGNIGKTYEKTRHNIGFQVLDSFQKTFHGNFSEFKENSKFNAFISEGMIEQEKIILAKPTSLYNTTGSVTHSIAAFYGIPSEEIIFIHDEIALPIGSLRISINSEAAGNNGIKDAIQKLGTKNFTRIRIGVDNTTREKMDTSDFVLSRFTSTEKKIINDLLPSIHEAMVDIVEHFPAIEKVQNIYN
jgi:PTH1 family peptidyl-tRNA hydrolase